MPSTFPEMWLARVITIITSLTSAPWLDGIPELDTSILEVGSGTASEQNLIHVPIENYEVDVLLNNTTYPIAVQAFDDTSITIQLDKYQTKVTTLSDDQIMGASYPKIDSATRAHTRSMLKEKFKKAIHALAPAANTANTPVLDVIDSANGVMAYEDLVALKKALDNADVPAEGRRLVLSSNHYNDLLKDRKNFGDQLVNYREGSTAPLIAGFQIYSYLAMPYYNASKEKLAYGAVPGVNDKQASVCFLETNVAKKTGTTKQYFKDAANDPDNQTNRLNYRHYFIATPFQGKYAGAII